MPQHTDTTFATLNARQLEAVQAHDGPMLVLAGAGAGKTRVITHRILSLMKCGVDPQAILAVTFTNKAAREMRERMHTLIAADPALGRAPHDGEPTLSTFHALCVRMLRENHRALDLRRHFTIYDRSDSMRAIKRALERAGYSSKQFEPRRILSIISRAKGNAHDQLAFKDAARTYPEEVAAEVWEHYDRIVRDEHALDFDDLLLRTNQMLQNDRVIREHYRERFAYVHIDEYQDTNAVQYEIARTIAGARANVCAVGDIDQNIYSWRGADISNIMQFERHFPGAKIVLLEENYRSTQAIIAASNAIIEKNRNRVPKTVFTNNGAGEPLGLYIAHNEADEAHFVAETAHNLIAAGASPSSIAVLFRTNFQSRALEEAFIARGIAYQMLGVRFFERKEVKDVLAFLRYALNPGATSDLSRIINAPPRGIGKVTLLKLIEGRRADITGAIATKVAAFEALIAEIGEVAHTRPVSETLRHIIARSGIEQHLKDDGDEGQERLLNLRELVALAVRYDAYTPEEGVIRLLEDVALQSDQDELPDVDTDMVKLMTVHAAKGLEFSYVFITGLEEGLFPHERMAEEGSRGRDEEEERRLFYVALTRAEKKIFLSYACMRTIFGSQRINEPSSFVRDIPETYLEMLNPAPVSGFERTILID